VCNGTVKQLADEARKPGSLRWAWARDNKRQQVLRARRGETPATAEPAA
jgi:NADH dehydrogenase